MKTLLPNRAAVSSLAGYAPMPGVGLGDWTSLVAGFLPNITGQSSTSAFTTLAAGLEQSDQARAQQKRIAVTAAIGVTVVGLGLLTYFLAKR